MSSSLVSVRLPGGFGDPAGGGSQDPRKPGGQPPGREHEKERVGLSAAQKARRKAAKQRRRAETKAKAAVAPESDVPMSSQSRGDDVKAEDDSDVVFVGSQSRSGKSSSSCRLHR